MENPADLQIRTMTRDELDLAVGWAAEEGWNPGLADAECFHAADAGGFLVGVLAGEPAGSISVVRYEGGFGFLGFYIVRPALRGRGYGYRLWQAGIARLAGHAIGLDGVIAQQDNYRKSGFVLAHRNVRYGGVTGCDEPRDPTVMPIRREHVEDLIRYDRGFFPAARAAFLECWLDPGRHRGLALVENGSLGGYGVIRRCRSGFKIGPLFAETDEGADLLFRGLAAAAGSEPVFLDCPEPNRAAIDLATRHGLSPVFETARMYRGAAPDLPLRRIYGITTFELG
jgi:hypothetical protein